MVVMAVAMTAAMMTAAMVVARQWRRGEGGGDGGGNGGAAMAARRWRWRGEGQGDDVNGQGRRREEEKTASSGTVWGRKSCLSTRCERSNLCLKSPFSGTLFDWVFQHWSPRNVTSCHKDCPTKRAVGDRAVRKKTRKYSLIPN